jgi:hypothetical protein
MRRTVFKVADQRLDAKLGAVVLDAPDRLRDVRGAPVIEVVAVHHRQHDVCEPHFGERHGCVFGLIRIDRTARLASVDRAEPATPGAGLAEDHHRCGALPPAFEDIGATGLLAHGV